MKFDPTLFKEGIPSCRKALITSLTGERLVSLKRYNLILEESAEGNPDIDAVEIFEIGEGPLYMEFESGLSIGVASLNEPWSVTLWVLTGRDGEVNDESMVNDDELHATDSSAAGFFWHDFIGKRIASVTVMQLNSDNALISYRQCEVGLVFRFTDDSEFIAGHGLHNGSDDFCVIPRHKIIDKLLNQLAEI